MDACFVKLVDFIDTAKIKANGTVYQDHIRNIIANLAKGAGNRVDRTPPELRPSGIDHLLWRQYEIVDAQAINIRDYLVSERWNQIGHVVNLQKDIVEWIKKDQS
jgi:hypothetical protein